MTSSHLLSPAVRGRPHRPEATQDRGPAKTRRQGSKDADTRAAEAELHEALGLEVEIRKGKGEKGELRIRYATLEQLEEIRHRLLRRR